MGRPLAYQQAFHRSQSLLSYMAYKSEVSMACYLIAQINVRDRQGYKKYLDGFDEVFKDYKGVIMAADKNPTVLEGEWPFQRTVLIRFPDADEAQRWYRSPQYQKLAEMRKRVSDSNIVLVEGR